MITSRILQEQTVVHPTAQRRRRIPLQAFRPSTPYPTRGKRLHTKVEEEDDIIEHPSTPNAIVRRRLLVPKSRVLDKRVFADMHGRVANPCTVPPRRSKRRHTEIVDDEIIEHPSSPGAVVRKRRFAVKGKVRDGTLFAYVHGRAAGPTTPPPDRNERLHMEMEDDEVIEHPDSLSAIVRRRRLAVKGKVRDGTLFAPVYGRRW
jgi:hypothetical protein